MWSKVGAVRFAAFILTAVCAMVAGRAHAQTAPLAERFERLTIDSGPVSNAGPERGVIWSTVVTARRAPWLRLHFAIAQLGPPAFPMNQGAQPTLLRLTALQDGAVQTMNATHLEQWQNSSCYFNGDKVRVEIIADPGAAPSRIAMVRVRAGRNRPAEPELGGIATLCGPTDDRVLSSDPALARMMPVGCTAWMIDDVNHSFLTAGHCGPFSAQVVQFNVPLSTGGGVPVAPPPQDQYAVDPASVQSNFPGSLGNDWAYFGCFRNTNTNLTPFEAQSASFTLADAAPPVESPTPQTIRVTGFGTTTPPVSMTWNQVQKTHTGPYVGLVGTRIDYAVDTTGGDSGSPVFDVNTGRAIGIHTNGACETPSMTNIGTAIQNAGLQTALANPLGVSGQSMLSFAFPDGLPEMLPPDEAVIRVHVNPGTGSNGAPGQPGTGVLHYNINGAGWFSAGMTQLTPNVYDAIFPAMSCFDEVDFYFSATTTTGTVVNAPLDAPASFHAAVAATSLVQPFVDDFTTDLGWTVTNDATLTAGAWERGVPVAAGDPQDPPTDADGSGKCYLTQNALGASDVDGGATTLTSPVMDASDPASVIEYYRWFSISPFVVPVVDLMRVEVSDDGGTSWQPLEIYSGNTNAWIFKSWLIADIPNIDNTNQFRIRFKANDSGPDTTVEGGIDGVRLSYLVCEMPEPCPGDIAPPPSGNGIVNVGDLLALISVWGPCVPPGPGCVGDLNDDGTVSVADLLDLISVWGACP